jgi:hypothetical protein
MKKGVGQISKKQFNKEQSTNSWEKQNRKEWEKHKVNPNLHEWKKHVAKKMKDREEAINIVKDIIKKHPTIKHK